MLKIALVCSAGGHLTELLQLKKSWQNTDHFFITDKRMDSQALAKNNKTFFLTVPRRNPVKLLINFFQALNLYFKTKPNLVISTGADTAIPFCLIAKFFGAKIIFIESFARIKEPSLSARIMYPFADKFFVQWPQNKKFFPKAEFVGGVF